MPNQFEKDPQAKLDYHIDWSLFLGSDTISTSVWTVPDGITKVSDSNTSTISTIWVSGGTLGVEYSLVCHITTAAGRQDDRTVRIRIISK